jgi:hypothetical protein
MPKTTAAALTPLASAPTATVRIRHTGSHATGAPLAFGPYATGGVIHAVDPATAARLLARGFERVTDVAGPSPSALTPEE